MARCLNCDTEIIADGCDCSVQDSDCFSVTGSGSAENPLTVEPILDPDADNLLTCGASGLLALLPAYISDPPAVHAYRTTNQSLAHNNADVVTFNAERYDTDTMWSAGSPTRITFKTAGVYTVTFDCYWDKNASGDRQCWIRKNGSDFLVSDSKHAGDADLFVGHSVIAQEEFAVNDYVEAIVKQDTGGNLNLLADRFSPILAATFRRRAT